jgi:hypothetical protein
MDSGDFRTGDVQLDQLMREFYEVISFEEGQAPQWTRMAGLFSPHARITRLTPEGIDYMDLDGFRALADELIEVGVYTSFYEREVGRHTQCFGGVVHIASAFETRISKTARDYIERGVNSLQLIRDAGSWRIISLCWDTAAEVSCVED